MCIYKVCNSKYQKEYKWEGCLHMHALTLECITGIAQTGSCYLSEGLMKMQAVSAGLLLFSMTWAAPVSICKIFLSSFQAGLLRGEEALNSEARCLCKS